MNKIVQDKVLQGTGAVEIARFEKNAAYLEASGMYDPAEEHANCGVGLVGAIDGKPRREVVEAGIEALKAIWHRGALMPTVKPAMAQASTFRFRRISLRHILKLSIRKPRKA